MNKSTSHHFLRGASSLLFATFLWGFYGILARTIAFNLPLFYQSWTRGFLSSAILFLFILYLRSWKKVEKKDRKWIIARSVIGAVSFALSFTAFNFIPIGTAYFNFFAGSTVGGYILAYLLFGEKFTPVRVLALLLALSGIGWIYSFSFSASHVFYMLFAFVSGLGNGVWNTFSKKISGSYTTIQLNFLDMFIFSLFCLVASLIIGETWIAPNLTAPWIANGLFGIMFLITGQLVIIGYKYLEAQIATLMGLMEIIFGIIFSYLYFHETIALTTWIGGALVIIAIILPEINWKKLRIRITTARTLLT